jgi:hypothetical protein
MTPILLFLIYSGSKEKKSRYTCLSEAKASHSHRIWVEVLSSAHTSYTMDCLTVPLGEDVFSGYYDQLEDQ